MSDAITLQDICSFDTSASLCLPVTRFLCLFCGHSKPLDPSHRCFSLNVSEGVYYCHRCGAKGRLGSDTTFREKVKQLARLPQKPKLSWREVLDKSGMTSIDNTAGEEYLTGRGISVSVAKSCCVQYANALYGKQAVVFPVRNQSGEVIAIQGRFINSEGLRMMTIGPKKQGCFQTPNVWTGAFAITEAPIDAMSLYALGYPAIATCGGGIPDWLPRASRGKTVWIATDNDEAGERYFSGWKPILEYDGAAVKRLRPPKFKDWNEELRNITKG